MIIEAGKFYRTRDGRKARIYATDGSGRYPVHGNLDGEALTWTSRGAFNEGVEGESGRDLIAPWTDAPEVDWSAMPKWARWVAMDEDGAWFWYQHKPERSDRYFSALSEEGVIPFIYAPDWDGDWKDTLVERPKGE